MEWLVTRRWVLGVLLVVAGCSGRGSAAPPPGYDGGAPDVIVPPPRQIEVVGPQQLSLGFGDQATFTVRYEEADGTPIVGEMVSFALQGSANDASLTQLTATTDANGEAMGTIAAGTIASVFHIRVTADRAEPVYIDVSVSDQGFGMLDVTVPSSVPSRQVSSRQVVIFAGASCSDSGLAMMQGDLQALLGSSNMVTFPSLPAGSSYAVAVRLSSAGGTLVGWGCTDAAITAGQTTQVTVVPQALPLVPDGVYDAALALDATSEAQAASQAIEAAGSSLLTGANGDANLLLAAFEMQLDSTNQSLFDQLIIGDPSVAGSLQSALDGAGVGPTVAVTDLAQTVQSDLAAVVVHGPLTIDPSATPLASWQVAQVDVGPAGGSPVTSIPATDLSPQPSATVDLSLDLSQDALSLSSLQLDLPLGGVATGLVADEAASAGASSAADLLQSDLGCPTFASWAMNNPEILFYCTSTLSTCAQLAQAACTAAAQQLANAISSALAGLDATHSTVVFMPVTPAPGTLSDTSGDLKVDTIAVPGLSGAWSTGPSATSPAVTGALDATRTGDLP